MGVKTLTSFNLAIIFYIYLILPLVTSVPLPNGQLQFPARSSYSTQQFTMYKPIQVGYSSPPGGFRPELVGNPVFHYNYNVSHPPKPFEQLQSQGLLRAPGQSSPGVVLTPHQVQYLRQEQQQQLRGVSGQLNMQQGQPLQSQYQRQYQKNQVYAPVIIANPRVIANPTNFQQQTGYQNSIVSGQSSTNPGQFFVDDYTEPETEGIGFRLNNDRSRIGKARTISGSENGGNIIFDPRIPGPQSFQFPSDNGFSGQNRNQFANSRQGQGQPQAFQPYNSNSYNPSGTTTRPPIQIPYLTTPSALKKLQQLQKNSQQTISGFRSSLGLINPSSQQTTSWAGGLSRHSAINPAIRSARVQNIVVPVSTVGQTPAGTRLLQNNLNSLQNLQDVIARNVYTHQNSGPLHPGIDLSSPNLHILKGLAITPENQRDVGQLFFSNPQNPSLPQGAGSGAVLASSAQKVFILPQSSSLTTTDSENLINFNNDEQSPAEIVITVVDEDSSDSTGGGEKGKVLSNFSLFLMPSSYKKCVDGYKRAHDGKCRLIIKLRGRSRVYSG